MTTQPSVMATHTPGPWRVSDTTYPDVWDIVTDDDSTLIVQDANSEANAQLIAAAPEMYAALKALLDPDVEGDIHMAVHAIAKAEGREP